MAGFEPTWLAALQLPQTLLLIVACFLLGEIALSPASPGANSNASGVAAVLEVVRRLGAEPPVHLRVEVAILGGGETTMQGMWAWVREHRAMLDRSRTWFISLESVGRGDPRYVLSQGPAVSLPMDPELAGICEALSGGDGHSAEPMRDGGTSAAFVARTCGYRALPITCIEPGRGLPEHRHTPSDVPETIDPGAIERASSLTVDLIRLLDRELGRSAPAPSVGPKHGLEAGARRPSGVST